MSMKVKVLIALTAMVSFASCSLPLDAAWEDCPIYDSKIAENGEYYFGTSINQVLYWVNRNISYAKDVDNYGLSEYWAFPEETLEKRRGDCEDFAILFAYLVYRKFGIKVEFSIEKRHMECHMECYYNGMFYDPTNFVMPRTTSTEPELFILSFDDVMSKCGLYVM